LRFVVLRGGALGDLLLTFPVLQALRKIASPSKIRVELIAPFPAASLGLLGGADAVSDLNSAAFLSLFADGSSLSEKLCRKFGETDCVLFYLSDRQGSIQGKIEKCGCRFIPGPFKLDGRRIPATIQLAEPLHALGISRIDPVLRLALVQQNRSSRLAFHVGSGSPAKNWSADRWTQLVASLEGRFSELLLVSGEADGPATADFLRQYRNPKLKHMSCLSILDLAHELSASELFIGHDSGPTHLAAALGVPTVALFGPTDSMIWRPLGEHVQVVPSENGQMDGLRLDKVQSGIEALCGRKELGARI
jgi:ADP-heptose:LPS heptosyltransferase